MTDLLAKHVLDQFQAHYSLRKLPFFNNGPGIATASLSRFIIRANAKCGVVFYATSICAESHCVS